jgi:alkylresorcinol/alkylpyrone synthase
MKSSVNDLDRRGSRILSVAGVLPPHRYPQADITDFIAERVLGEEGVPDRAVEMLTHFHQASKVDSRYLALPLEQYTGLTFGSANDVYLATSVHLLEQAGKQALAEAGIRPQDVDLVVLASSTGIATPSLDARVIPGLGLSPNVKRLPLFGLGCVAGAAGVARCNDYLVGHPDEIALLLTVELPSLTFQRADPSVANLVASGLFGDGAAAVVLAGATAADRVDVAGPEVLASRSRWYPDSERVMGWDVVDSGFTIVLDARVPEVVATYLRDDVDGFLRDQGLAIGDIATWVAHPGGPKVLEAMVEALGVRADSFEVTWRCLADIGNISSSSVLHVLERTLRAGLPKPGTAGLMTALGPGFCSELVLLRW